MIFNNTPRTFVADSKFTTVSKVTSGQQTHSVPSKEHIPEYASNIRHIRAKWFGKEKWKYTALVLNVYFEKLPDGYYPDQLTLYYKSERAREIDFIELIKLTKAM